MTLGPKNEDVARGGAEAQRQDLPSSAPPRLRARSAFSFSAESIYVVLALLLSFGFWLTTQAYWIPIARNNDANAYVLGGLSLAEGHWHGVKPPDPYVFFGQHWVMVRSGRYQLKFPTGLPLAYAMIRWIGGSAHWPADAYELSPLLATLGIYGTFLLIRAVTNSFYAFLGAVVLAASPETLFFALKPNSHACSLCVVAWGMFFLIRWWQTEKFWQGLLAGLILGFNFTVRYTEGLLLIPITLAVFFVSRRRRITVTPRTCIPLIGWLIPVCAQSFYNAATLHHFSGYGMTNESTAFSIHYFLQYWPAILTGLYDTCLFFILPLSVLGSIVMFTTDWRLALIVCSWFLPPILLYTAYYWSPDNGGPATLPYLRFLITSLPGLILVAIYLLHQLSIKLNSTHAMVAAGAVVAVMLASALPASTGAAAQLQWNGIGGEWVAEQARDFIPPGSAIFAEGHDMVLLAELGYEHTYASDLFSPQSIAPLGRVDPDAPQELQPERAQSIFMLLGGLNDRQLIERQNDLVRQNLSDGRRVYAILPADACRRFCNRYLNGRGFKSRVVSNWTIDGKWNGEFTAPVVRMQLISIESN